MGACSQWPVSETSGRPQFAVAKWRSEMSKKHEADVKETCFTSPVKRSWTICEVRDEFMKQTKVKHKAETNEACFSLLTCWLGFMFPNYAAKYFKNPKILKTFWETYRLAEHRKPAVPPKFAAKSKRWGVRTTNRILILFLLKFLDIFPLFCIICFLKKNYLCNRSNKKYKFF